MIWEMVEDLVLLLLDDSIAMAVYGLTMVHLDEELARLLK